MALQALWAATALAQAPADVNPAVNTSAAQADAPHAPAAQPTQPTQPAQPVPTVKNARAPTPDRPATAQAAATAAAGGSTDRIELGTTEISGNRELPKLMYIVPWQRAEVGKISGRPPNSLVDEALTPVDRSVFERQNSYYAALQAASASAASQPAVTAASPVAAAPRDEK